LPVSVAASSCLFGEEVRFDGGHKHNGYLTKALARHRKLIPFCPEVAIGLGVPRRPIRLVKKGEEVRVVGVDDSALDVTKDLAAYGHAVAVRLNDVSGYIFKRGSPSCGMERVKVYSHKGMPVESFCDEAHCCGCAAMSGRSAVYHRNRRPVTRGGYSRPRAERCHQRGAGIRVAPAGFNPFPDVAVNIVKVPWAGGIAHRPLESAI
jgi:uncharacterized protein YbbK (DUF523 family)